MIHITNVGYYNKIIVAAAGLGLLEQLEGKLTDLAENWFGYDIVLGYDFGYLNMSFTLIDHDSGDTRIVGGIIYTVDVGWSVHT